MGMTSFWDLLTEPAKNLVGDFFFQWIPYILFFVSILHFLPGGRIELLLEGEEAEQNSLLILSARPPGFLRGAPI